MNTGTVQTKPNFGPYAAVWVLRSQEVPHRGFMLWFFKSGMIFQSKCCFCPHFSTLVHPTEGSWWMHTRFICIKLILKIISPSEPTCKWVVSSREQTRTSPKKNPEISSVCPLLFGHTIWWCEHAHLCSLNPPTHNEVFTELSQKNK